MYAHPQRYIRLFTFEALDGHVNHGSIRSQMYVRYGVRPPAVRYVQSQTASEVQPPTAYGTRTTTGTKNNRQSFCKSVAINFSSFWATLLAWNTENTSRTVEKVVRGFGESFGSNELLITVFRGKIYFLHDFMVVSVFQRFSVSFFPTEKISLVFSSPDVL